MEFNEKIEILWYLIYFSKKFRKIKNIETFLRKNRKIKLPINKLADTKQVYFKNFTSFNDSAITCHISKY